MTDEIDRAQAQEQLHLEAAIAAARGVVPALHSGTCLECGNPSDTLRNGICTECRQLAEDQNQRLYGRVC